MDEIRISPFSRRAVDRRVPEAQAQARRGLTACLLITAAAATVAIAGGDRWIAVHLFVAGGLVSAFSGVSVMLTATWSTAPAPPPGFSIAQLSAVVVGSLGIVIGRHLDAPGAVFHGFGTIYLAGLIGLAALLVDTVRHGSKRRFGPAVTGWVAALALAVLGTIAGITLASGASVKALRSVHLTTNLLGFLGVAIATTIPFFGSTVVRAKMNPKATPAALNLTTALLAAGPLIAVIGLAGDVPALTAAGYALHAIGLLAIYRISPRPTGRQLEWAGPRMIGLWAGGVWWAIAVLATAVDGLRGTAPLTGRWLVVLLVGGYAQILWASLAYVLPMLRGGGHELLGRGFATTRSRVTLAGLQIAALTAVLRAGTVFRIMVAIVVLDSAIRIVRLVVEPRLGRAGAGA